MPVDFYSDKPACPALDEELLILLSRQARIAPIPVTLATAIIAAISLNHLPAWIVGCWVLLVLALLILRRIVLARLPELTQIPLNKRLRIATQLMAAIAFSHGLSLGFFPFLSDFERAIQALLLVSLCTTSIMITAGYRPIVLIYFIFILAPLLILWAWYPGLEGNLLNQSIALAGILYCLVQYRVASNIFKLLIKTIEGRQHLAKANLELESALQQAESASAAKTRFLASASHDLRQPINTLSLFCAALNTQHLNKRARDISDHMYLALSSLTSQLDALLDISRLDAGVVAAHHARVNLHSMLQRLGKEFSLAVSEKGLELSVSAPEDAVIYTDQVLLERIIRNLLCNAIKYTEQGSISLLVTSSKAAYKLQVKDTGPGIARELHDKIFEEFYQADNKEQDRFRGLGLGLAISRQLTELLSMDLELRSSLGAGSTFSLIIDKPKHPGHTGTDLLVATKN